MAIPSTNSGKQAGWSLGDVLDFECLIEQGAERSEKTFDSEGHGLASRFGSKPVTAVPRRVLFREWIALRRERERALPGKSFDRIFRIARAVMWAGGVAFGGVSAAGYLAYFGNEPVNVFWFLLWLVVFPVLLTLSAFCLGYMARDAGEPAEIGHWLFGKIFKRLPGSMSRAWGEWTGVLEKNARHLAPVVTWPLFGLTQRFACAFGLGALVALLGFLMFKDIAFGWQSTIGISAEAWHAVARVISSPWAWAFPGGCPSLENVRASQYTHIGGMAALDPAATRAWWPFLVGCLAVWSVGVRTIFIAWIAWKGRGALEEFKASLDAITHTGANALFRKLYPSSRTPNYPPSGSPASDARKSPMHGAAAEHWLVLVADGVPTDPAVLSEAIREHLHGAVSRVERVEIDDADANTDSFSAVKESADRTVVVIPAARDPIIGIRKTLQQILAAGSGRECAVLLHGNPERLNVWRRFANASRLDVDVILWPAA